MVSPYVNKKPKSAGSGSAFYLILTISLRIPLSQKKLSPFVKEVLRSAVLVKCHVCAFEGQLPLNPMCFWRKTTVRFGIFTRGFFTST